MLIASLCISFFFFLLFLVQTDNEKEKVVVEACGDLDDDDDDEMEEEEMFVDAHPSFEHQLPEWGGPRRGGRFPEVRSCGL